ncbi:MAG: acyltransferase [Veillonella sp.]|uniref:acyltransferase family protein n=1 Tax=Veillonella sp. TaxID=1926307 RepID=UPI002903260F|nr:acyltransferase [Veillonella sp.]MDU1973111.1 acyltransferase [Veillonella sp.]MDU5003701.1 acyltransferase [Veillonella sp.]
MRIEWLDSLKGFAIFLVVVGHVILGYMHTGMFIEHQWSLQFVYDVIYSFHMPLFFIISGFLYKLTWRQKDIRLAKSISNKVLNMVLMYILFSVVFWIFKYIAAEYGNIQMSDQFILMDLLYIFISPLAYLWFLYVLIWLFLTVPIFESIIKPTTVFIIFLCLYFFMPPVHGLLKIINLIIYGGVYFTLGSVLCMYQDQLRTIICNKLIGIGFISIVLAVITFPYIEVHNILKFICATSGSVFLSILFFKFKNIKWVTIWNLCGRYSLGIYILHLYFSGPLRTIFKHLSIDNIMVCLILSCLISTIVPIFIVKFFDRYKITSWIFGNSKLIKLKL